MMREGQVAAVDDDCAFSQNIQQHSNEDQFLFEIPC